MKRFLIALALTCVLSGAALAEDIPSCGYAPPPPPATASVTATGEIPSDDFAQPTLTDEVIVNVLEILGAGYLSIY